ncbi:hypothetical protein [Polymorphobacter fuscus]|uniref:Barstar (barnase inhibitor) domain-containing protein n=1 Tax=Sandarakinorhabdus fusca TaxID=1439888 RepID=A0A7C9GM21_9SPHN|nr:hypothetical protein [Polymorphobacter fuscus]KAB7648156.1 hypothetical protein F9290_00025 [Polymorphobacter fuscus]MQT15652.1 hypothetical protein [Polymorphobacter fuscus]NJC08078.1 hypothetical protein [Polymorphobacter fuscus]
MPYEIFDHSAPVGGRIAFRHTEPGDNPAEYVTPATLASQDIIFAYLDGSTANELEALNSLGVQLKTDHPPYDPHPSKGIRGWYRLMDDLETLGDRETGMVVVVDNAAPLFADPTSWVFELITIWTLQLARWQRRGAPCHLVFQMDANPAVASVYGTIPSGS